MNPPPLIGTYSPPRVRRGQVVLCEYRDKWCRVSTLTTAPIPWPRCNPVGQQGGGGLLVNDTLRRAILTESATALCFWFGVSTHTVLNWRRAFGVGRDGTEGSRRALYAASLAGAAGVKAKVWTAAERKGRSERAARTARRGRPVRPDDVWRAEEIALLGTAPDRELARLLGRSLDAVRKARRRHDIPNPSSKIDNTPPLPPENDMTVSRLAALALGILAATAAPAFAHTDTGSASGGGFAAGLLHPLFGVDHVLAMFAVGLLSAQNGGRGRWVLPAVFLVGMTVGGVVGMAGVKVAGVEYLIAASVFLIGAAVALNRKTRPALVAVAVAAMAAVHGHAHGAEVPATASPALYVAGFLLGTSLLLVAGGRVGRWAMRRKYGKAGLRWSGAAVAAAGVLVAFMIET